MIVFNEAAFLKGCISSISAHVDEIVIVDTGSTDESREIASAAGARVLEAPWRDDFAAARNVGLEACRTDWVLSIDADERLVPDARTRLMDSIDPDCIGAWVSFRPKSGFTRYLEPRLRRCDPGLRFIGRIHETLSPDLLSASRAAGAKIGCPTARIDHLGYDADPLRKQLRNLPLLEKAVSEQPERIFLWHDLAQTLDGLGRHEEALAAAESGLAVGCDAEDERSLQHRSLIYQFLARSMLRSGEDPIHVLTEASARVPSNHALTFLLAQRHLAMGEHACAIAAADTLLSIDPEQLPLSFLAFDKRIFGEAARGIKAKALIALGRPADALVLLRAAEPAKRTTYS